MLLDDHRHEIERQNNLVEQQNELLEQLLEGPTDHAQEVQT